MACFNSPQRKKGIKSNETYDVSSSEGYGAALKPSNSYSSPSPKCQEPANEGSVAASEQPIS
ncbi:hypothetical protein DEO72_LG1g2704 [Vigna unguiculata]|uniref:Uncharacterized protein n=1 Tax=Vigna unguiculata TaxID=3917 RepID=A0A4D6KLY7_VIGUN|nr:hypothetical protein DEO72_LG1g2704 [Vigna unguiculata]